MTPLFPHLLLGFLLVALATHKLLQTLTKYRHARMLEHGSLREPPVVPYSIPWIGHSISLLSNMAVFLRECRKNYGEIYKVVVGGHGMVVVSASDAIHNVYTSPKSLVSINEEHFMRMCHLTHMNEEQFRDIFKHGIAVFSRAFSPRNFTPLLLSFNQHLLHEISSLTATNSRVISLEYTFFTVMQHCISRALWGEEFPLTPEADEDNHAFAGNTGDVRTHLPFPLPFYTRAAVQLHDRVTERMSAFFDRVAMLGCTPPIIAQMFQWAEKYPSLTQEQRANIFAVGNWAVHTNLTRAPFWIIAYLLLDEGYLSLQSEIRHTIVTKYGGLERFLSLPPAEVDPSDFELLDSGIQETLRHISIGSSVRRAYRDTYISASDGQYAVAKDEFIIIDTRGVHFDRSIYGSNADSFQMNRFMKRTDESKTPPLPLAFALGPTRCKGTEFSLHALRTVLITFVELYDAYPVTKTVPPFNKHDCMGVHRPAGEFLIQITPRTAAGSEARF